MHNRQPRSAYNSGTKKKIQHGICAFTYTQINKKTKKLLNTFLLLKINPSLIQYIPTAVYSSFTPSCNLSPTLPPNLLTLCFLFRKAGLQEPTAKNDKEDTVR